MTHFAQAERQAEYAAAYDEGRKARGLIISAQHHLARARRHWLAARLPQPGGEWARQRRERAFLDNLRESGACHDEFAALMRQWRHRPGFLEGFKE